LRPGTVDAPAVALDGATEAKRASLRETGASPPTEAAGPHRIPAAAPASAPDAGGAAAVPASTLEDAVISGIVRVDGRAPEWPVRLTLDPREPPAPPPSEQGLLKRRSTTPRELVIAPENGGAFAFHDLPHGWSGRLLAMEHPLRIFKGNIDVLPFFQLLHVTSKSQRQLVDKSFIFLKCIFLIVQIHIQQSIQFYVIIVQIIGAIDTQTDVGFTFGIQF
jgi:hypothetical protein